jgi:hypothetical protein
MKYNLGKKLETKFNTEKNNCTLHNFPSSSDSIWSQLWGFLSFSKLNSIQQGKKFKCQRGTFG